MWNNTIKLDFFEELIFSNRFLLRNLLEKDIPEALFTSKNNVFQEMNRVFPNCSDEEKLSILYILLKAYFRSETEKMQLIWSGPSVAGLPGRDTELVFEEYIQKANKSIMITIYALSDYALTLVEILKKKARQGVYIEIYVNDYESKKTLLKEIVSLDYKRVFIYEYTGATNKTQSLHAKVLTIDDEKSIITSSNLSYNGMDGNLELGVILDSREKAKEIRAIFNSLINKNYFQRIRNA